MRVNVGWKWKAGASPPQIGCSTCKFSPRVAFDDWLKRSTTKLGGMWVFLAAPTVLGVIDTYGIELIHPIREGCSPQQIGRKGLSNHRWIVGGKLCLLLNQYGLVVGWDCAAA